MMAERRIDEMVQFDARGLVPAVIQDADTGDVLMVAWMNREALRLTRDTGQVHFWSRSRRELWRKGATSGNVLHLRELWIDCDGDTLLARVDPQGPACHTGERSCFFRPLVGQGERSPSSPAPDILEELFAVILDRRANPPQGSYTAHLFASGEDEILKKIGEEAMEVVLAAKAQGDDRLVSELADLIYHLLVLLGARGLELSDVERELEERRR